MIARKAHPQHPDKPSRYVLVPLAYDRQSGEWRPLMAARGYHVNEFRAATACYGDWMRSWRRILRLTRTVRALCEHPAFADLNGDGIDTEIIIDNVRQLASTVEMADINIERLLDKPGQDDRIRIAGVLCNPDPNTQLLTPSRDSTSKKRTPTADEVFLGAIHRALAQAHSESGYSVTLTGFEEAIDTLILLLPEDVDSDDNDGRIDVRDPMQFIADHRFTRFLVAAAKRGFGHTGKRVSIRGLQHTIAVLERLLEDRMDREDSNALAEFDGPDEHVDDDDATAEFGHSMDGTDDPPDDGSHGSDNGSGA